MFVLLGRVGTFNRRLELHRRAEVNNGVRPPGQMFYPKNFLYDGGMTRFDYGEFRNAESSAAIMASPQFQTLDNTIIGKFVFLPLRCLDLNIRLVAVI